MKAWIKNYVTDIKKIWKTVKFFLSDKPVIGDAMNLIEKNEKQHLTQLCFQIFFSNLVKNFKILKFGEFDQTVQNIKTENFSKPFWEPFFILAFLQFKKSMGMKKFSFKELLRITKER